MSDFLRQELLIKVAKLYYEDGFSQGDICKELGFSRPYISKMIAEARERGIVSIKVHDSLDSETALERKLRMRFNLLRVFAVPFKQTENVQYKVALYAAQYFDSLIESGDIIAVSGGNTILNCANSMKKREDLENITVVQMDGCMINLSHSTYTQSIPKIIADAFDGIPIFYPVPLIVQNEDIMQAFLQEENIAHVRKLQCDANIALFTVGGAGMGRSTSAVQSNFLASSELDDMTLHGVVGNIGGHFLKKDGSLYNTELDRHVLSLPLNELKKKKHRILLASGRSKYEGVFAALLGGYVNILIVDTDMAQALALMSN